jgi:hypothetical protein
MDRERALDDIKVIRQVIGQTRQALGREGGWFGILWGIIWLVGFMGSHYLSQEGAVQLWTGLDILGGVISTWLGIRMGRRRRSSAKNALGLRFLGAFVALILFVATLASLLELFSLQEIALLIVLTIALSYILGGLFSDERMALIGLLIALSAVGGWLLLFDYFFLIMAFLGGGVLIGSGVWFLRTGK